MRREEAVAVPEDQITIIASGPLTSDALAAEIGRLTGSDRLFFYDSISPIVEADTIDMSGNQRLQRAGLSDTASRSMVRTITSTVPSTGSSMSALSTRCWLATAFRPISKKTRRHFLKLACRSKSWRGAGGRRFDSGQ